MELIKELKDEDLDLIDRYLHTFGDYRAMPAKKYLLWWEEAKSKYLWDVFGHRFTIEEPICYEKNEKDFDYEFEYLFMDNECYDNLITSLHDIVRFVSFGSMDYRSWDNRYAEANRLLALISQLHENVHGMMRNNHIEMEITLTPNSDYNLLEKKFCVKFGEKPFHLFNRIIKIFKPICVKENSEFFNDCFWAFLNANLEHCRLLHSRWLNDSQMRGTLVLSIHPMDYLTMSDNSYKWDSCMAWIREEDPGEYRVGVLEMMNSPCVVVAYVAGDKKFEIPYLNREWSNKKWRELFIVDHDFVAGICGYPYEHRALEARILNRLASLCEAYGWPKFNENIVSNHDAAFEVGDKVGVFSTYLMYNDTDGHGTRMLINSEPNYGWSYDSETYYYYSGDEHCIVCGEKYDNPQRPVCNKCNNIVLCNRCGEEISLDDRYSTYIVDEYGNYYCQDCLFVCPCCEEDFPPDEQMSFTVRFTDGKSYTMYCCKDCGKELQPYLRPQKVARIYGHYDAPFTNAHHALSLKLDVQVLDENTPDELWHKFFEHHDYRKEVYEGKTLAKYEEFFSETIS